MTKTCGKCNAPKLLADFARDRSRKDGLNHWCRACMSDYKRVYRKENAVKVKKWFDENRERHQQARDRWHRDNWKRRYEENKAVFIAHWAKRYARKLKARPLWADDKEIEIFYRRSRELTLSTGIPHVVDHIVPLQGESVCGLHCQANLRVITRAENSRKSNKFWPELLAENTVIGT